MTEIRKLSSASDEVLHSTLPDERITLDDLHQLVHYLVAGRKIMKREKIGLNDIESYDFSASNSKQFIQSGVSLRLLQKFLTVSNHLSGDTITRRRVEACGDFILGYTLSKTRKYEVCVYDNPSIADNIQQFCTFLSQGEARGAGYDILHLSCEAEPMNSLWMKNREHGKALGSGKRMRWAQGMERKVDAICPESPRAAVTEISHVSSGDISPESQARLYDMMQHYTPDSEHQTYAVRQMLGAAASINMELDALRRQGSTRAVVAQRKQELMHVWDQRLTSLSSEVRAASRASEEGLLSVGGATWSIGDDVPSQNTDDLR